MKTIKPKIDNKIGNFTMCLNTKDDKKFLGVNVVYIVRTSKRLISLQEVEVTKTIDGKTKYLPEQSKLIQSKRICFDKAPFSIDLFEDEKSYIYDVFDNEKNILIEAYYCFLNKKDAINKLDEECIKANILKLT